MLSRDEVLKIARQATAVLQDAGALARVTHEGYTRIDPFQVAEAAGVAVMRRPLDTLLGAFLREDDPGILVNIARPAGQVHMTCAHELGHFFLNHDTTFDCELDHAAAAPQPEREADRFAYCLLMPRSLVIDVMRRKGWRERDLRQPAVIYQLSLRLGTSFTATFWSLIAMRLLNGLTAAEHGALLKTPLQALKRRIAGTPAGETLSDVWLLDGCDRDRIIEPRAGDRLVVDLPDRASAGYLWSFDELETEGFILRPMDVGGDLPSAETSSDIVVGGSTWRRFSIEGDGLDAADIERRRSLCLVERRPWQPQHHADGVEFIAEYESLLPGLDDRSRGELIRRVVDA